MDFVSKTNGDMPPTDRSEDREKLDLANVADAKQLILSAGLDLKTYDDLIEQRRTRKEQVGENCEKLGESQIRKWLVKHGKKHLINFDDKERYKLKQFFKSLDEDGSGSIGTDELVDPLISLGIAQTREEVDKIVDSVDDDKSGQIEFKEFLQIIGGSSDDKGDTAIIDFFKDMISGRLAGGQISNKLPFNLIISTVRRRKLINSMMGTNQKDRVEGEKVMNAYSKLVAERKKDSSILQQPDKQKNKPSKLKTQNSKDQYSSTTSSFISRRSSKHF